MKSDLYEFDNQTKFKDTPRARHGLPWEAYELKELKHLYMQGNDLQYICDLMERPKAGVLPKLANLGLISKKTNGFSWIWRRKVLPDAWKVSNAPEKACGTNPAKLQSDPCKTYPYLETMVDNLENSVFKDAVSGVATAPDLSGLGLRAITATSPQPNLQTQPKEPIMKFETRVYISDVDASTLTDDQIFVEIRRAESRIEELKAIKTPTKKLADNITKLEKYAADLATYVDER